MVSQDIDRLMRLWSEDARISDAQHTPDDPSDDQTVLGQDAIRYRYTHFVFPSAPGSAQAENLDIHILGNQAEVTSTTHIGNVICREAITGGWQGQWVLGATGTGL